MPCILLPTLAAPKACASKVGHPAECRVGTSTDLSHEPCVFGKVVTGFAALQAVVAAVFDEAYIVPSHAEIAVPVTLALLFHQFTYTALKTLGHARTLTRIFSACNFEISSLNGRKETKIIWRRRALRWLACWDAKPPLCPLCLCWLPRVNFGGSTGRCVAV